MRISNGIRLAVLSLAVAGLASSRAEALRNDRTCTWSQMNDGAGGYIGTWDCGSCSASYVWRPGDSGWTSAGSSC